MSKETQLTEQIFQKYLLRDEKTVWTGQPEAGVHFSPEDEYLIPLTLLLGGGLIVWGLSALPNLSIDLTPAENASYLWGVVIIPYLWFIIALLAGLYLIVGRFVYKAWKKKRTYYALTNKRLLWISEAFGKLFNELYIENISDITSHVRSDGIGRLDFFTTGLSNENKVSGFFTNSGLDILTSKSKPSSFIDIKDADRVHKMIVSLKTSAG